MLTIPTAAELRAQFIANYESRLNQTIPLAKKAFIRVIATIEALQGSALYRFAVERTKQSFILTATGDDLKKWGSERGIDIKAAEKSILTATLPATTGTLIPSGQEFSSTSTNAKYTTDADSTAVGGVATLSLTAELTGTNGDLENGEFLDIGYQVAGAETVATVTGITNNGLAEETEPAYRRRILADVRNPGGGGNTADYRRWAEELTDVARAFPYSGKPTTFNLTGTDISFSDVDNSINTVSTDMNDVPAILPGDYVVVSGSALNDGAFLVATATAQKLTTLSAIATESAGASINLTNRSLPGDRTVFIESRIGDGVPTAQLLIDVRANINTDPDTGITRPGLGDTDPYLYVEPIIRTTFNIEVRGLVVPAALEATTKSKIDSAITTYFSLVSPFVTGLDYEKDKNNVITDLSISLEIQDVLAAAGASADGIAFNIPGGAFLGSYQLGQNELPGKGTISYA